MGRITFRGDLFVFQYYCDAVSFAGRKKILPVAISLHPIWGNSIAALTVLLCNLLLFHCSCHIIPCDAGFLYLLRKSFARKEGAQLLTIARKIFLPHPLTCIKSRYGWYVRTIPYQKHPLKRWTVSLCRKVFLVLDCVHTMLGKNIPPVLCRSQPSNC